MSTYVIGIMPTETFKKMKKVYDTCEEAGVTIPDEVWEFFNHETPNEAGVTVNVDKFVTKLSPHEGADGWEIDIGKLAKELPHVKKIQFINSY